jgi:ribosomal protein S18 acetylase RimI-like enzyme
MEWIGENMVYYKDNEILIRDMIQEDAQIITDEENAQGYHQNIEKYEMRLQHQAEKKAIVLTAEYKGSIAGYINIYPDAKEGPFANLGYPEIVDFGVLVKYRRHGIGKKLMDVAEEIAFKYSDTVYLGVGVHNGYGSAQRMYVKRGYIPDGSGVWYGSKVCEQYADCSNDDDLVLYFSKKLDL